MAIDVFISYSHHNRSFAEKLQLKLHHAGIKDTWMDNRIPNGAFWRPEIDRNLDAASLIVVVVSPKSMKSAYVTYEWCYSWFKRKKELYDLYWIYLLECKNKVGMFGPNYG